MDFQQVVTRRKMVRRFKDEPVSEASLRRLLANAVRGPSAGFTQGQAFVVIRGADLAGFWAAAGLAGRADVAPIPLVIVPLACKDAYLDRYAEPDKGWTDRDEQRWPAPFWYIDTGMAALLILQTAVDEGLGALYFGLRTERLQEIRDLLRLPADQDSIGAIAIGHPLPEPRSPTLTARRKPAGSQIHHGHWGGEPRE
jgi:nitroreductase